MYSFDCSDGVFFVDPNSILFVKPANKLEIMIAFKDKGSSVSVLFEDEKQKEFAEKVLATF